MIRFADLIVASGASPAHSVGDAEIERLVADSRQTDAHTAFVSMPSSQGRAETYAKEAISRGCVAVITGSPKIADIAAREGVAVALYDSEPAYQEALWKIAKSFFGNPSKTMKVYGVTGTNGKTTTAWILRQSLEWLGRKAAYVGTLGVMIESIEPLPNTTPFAVDLLSLFARLYGEQVKDVALEVSSHALAERRADGIEFDVGVFTNLSQDHLDFHGSMTDYEQAKARLFFEVPNQSTKPFFAAVNFDDPMGKRLAERLGDQCIRFGRSYGDLTAKVIESSADTTRCILRYHGDEMQVRVALGGSFNLYNLLASTAALIAGGYDLQAACASTEAIRAAPGRFEPVPNDQGLSILVDYAHTPDALEKVLAAARELTSHKLIVVFGCGGDRDQGKRPLMGRIAAQGADRTVLTSDNPRSEDPQSIIEGIQAGIPPGTEVEVILDRRQAIIRAIGDAQPGDLVLLAGKGHENYQIVGNERFALDDRLIAREALSLR